MNPRATRLSVLFAVTLAAAAGGGEQPPGDFRARVTEFPPSIGFSAVLSPDGKTVPSASGDKTAKLWDVATGKEVGALKGHADAVRDVAYSPDGAVIATASFDGTVILWDAATLRPLRTIAAHRAGVQCVVF